MNRMFNRWGYIFLAFFALAFITPALYIFGLDKVAGGIAIKIHEYIIYAFLPIFFIYPFIKGVQVWKLGNKGFAVGLFIVGLVGPVASGLLAIFLIEVIARAWSGKNVSAS